MLVYELCNNYELFTIFQQPTSTDSLRWKQLKGGSIIDRSGLADSKAASTPTSEIKLQPDN